MIVEHNIYKVFNLKNVWGQKCFVHEYLAQQMWCAEAEMEDAEAEGLHRRRLFHSV
jgi:hypothetical protein